MPRPTTHLLAIDPQNDFCDLPADWCPSHLPEGAVAPALPVAGAHDDMLRLAAFVDAAGDALDAITVTLDSHHRLDIAHPTFWTTGDGGPVAPFTAIAADQVRAGAFRPRAAAWQSKALAYLDALEAAGRYRLMVWPVHCEIGSWGHGVHAAVRAAVGRWEERRFAAASAVFKGTNPWTEHYSALQAEVTDPDAPETQLDRGLIARLDNADRIVVAGEASSHCVKATVEHLVEHLPSGRIDKLVLLSDCMSAVGGFEAQGRDFVEALRAQGATVATAAEAIALLQGDAA
ncbi:cysteine hydrolase [uncultured Xylophilus sp.]|uniref:cysteine hydrolase n=1 Tax=uncultured Xylophilus sp. TaxID=296832 RepID=UPI0025F77B9F|nr:cysteine hydrolase [uncultured Xylophilus sp.]